MNVRRYVMGAGFAVVVALMILPSAVSLGGVVVHGIGVGEASGTQGFGGGYVCNAVPFEVTAVYFPGNRGILDFNWASAMGEGDNCFIVSNGGGTAGGTINYDLGTVPPDVEWVPSCFGNEAQGLDCGAFGRVGPYAGIGSQMWYRMETSSRTFFGFFTAT